MSSPIYFAAGKGAGTRQSHIPPIDAFEVPVQADNFAVQAEDIAPQPSALPVVMESFPVQAAFQLPHFPFQPLPPPNGTPPFRFDLSQLLAAEDVANIREAGVLVGHSVGDTGDQRGQQQDFVASLMTQDSEASGGDRKPAFLYHLGDVVYFAGDIALYGANFYATYKDYPAFIVSIPGNHDCQPDDPQDGAVDPAKFPLDGWVKNFMAKDPGQLGSLKTGAGRTQMDLPNVYWTLTTPFATIIGLFSNVGETEGEIHQDQIDWFRSELKASNPDLALIVTVHHPPLSGDTEHAGSSAVYKMLFESFQATERYPHLILSGHVHNYQRFTNIVQGPAGELQIPCVVAGAGGYTNLGKVHKIGGVYPVPPLKLGPTLTLEQYDQDNFGFLRLEMSRTKILGTYLSAPYSLANSPEAKAVESFEIDVSKHTVRTVA